MSAAYDTRNKKFGAAKIRVLPAHDIKDATSLIKKINTKKIVADKAYDANWLHLFCKSRNIQPHIPLREWGKPKHHNLSARRQAAKQFRTKTYHRREMIEAGFSSLKRTMGSSVHSKKARTIRSDIYGRLACHNLFFWIYRHSGQSLPHPKLYKP